MRRFGYLFAPILLLLVTSCSTPDSVAQFNQAKSYADSGIGALLAASQAYLKGPPAPSAAEAAVVTQAMAGLTQLRTTLASATAPSANWKADALQALALMQQINPVVAPFLGAAGPLLPLANAVITAFVEQLPAPAAAPPTPPAALVRKSLEYRPGG